LVRDGQRTHVRCDGERVSPELHRLVRQCSHDLAGLLGKQS
jgi:hypothetical protein